MYILCVLYVYYICIYMYIYIYQEIVTFATYEELISLGSTSYFSW